MTYAESFWTMFGIWVDLWGLVLSLLFFAEGHRQGKSRGWGWFVVSLMFVFMGATAMNDYLRLVLGGG